MTRGSLAGLVLIALCLGPAQTAAAQSPDIRPADLLLRVERLAHDSMRGRAAGTAFDSMAAEYVAGELRRVGAQPGGENGTFFQTIPAKWRTVTGESWLEIDGRRLQLWRDFAPALPPRSTPGSVFEGRAVWGGQFTFGAPVALDDSLIRGRVVVMQAPPRGVYAIGFGHRLAHASAVVFVSDETLEPIQPILRRPALLHGAQLDELGPAPVNLMVTRDVAARLMGRPLDDIAMGTPGRASRGGVSYRTLAAPLRNVIGVLPGAGSPAEYVGLSAHIDGIGIREPAPVDADSARLANRVLRPDGTSRGTPMTAEELAALEKELLALRRTRSPRQDSVFNGADDDASGTAMLLELAEWLAVKENRPRRSTVFLFHTAEELGMVGSDHFVRHPTVALDAMHALVNVDMIGRAPPAAGNDSSGYLEVIGAGRRSSRLRALVDSIAGQHRIRLGYDFDAAGHPQRRFCRSDHWSYAKVGIPVAFLSTGLHSDYHQVSDEVEHLDMGRMARATSFLADLVRALGAAHLTRDRPAPDAARCVQ